MVKITPSPGIYLVELIETEDSPLVLQTKSQTRLLKGKVLAVGKHVLTDFNAVLYPFAKVNQTIYFLSYEGNYDTIDKKIYLVKFQDLRGVMK